MSPAPAPAPEAAPSPLQDERFLASYAREADDFDLYSVVDFYEGYRAFVRGKVAAMLAGDEGAGADARRRAAGEARRYFLLALSASRASVLRPAVVAVGGVIASGKSTIAARVAAEASAPVVEADRARKAMLGAGALDPLHERRDAEGRGGDVARGARPVAALGRSPSRVRAPSGRGGQAAADQRRQGTS